MTYAAMKNNAYSLRDKDMMLLADSHGFSKPGDLDTVIPYSGKFNLSGKFVFEGWGTGTAIATNWVLKIARKRGAGDADTVIIGDFTFNNTTSPQTVMPPVSWSLPGIDLQEGDRIIYKLQCMNDTTFATNYPTLAFVPLRSYFVIEDENTQAGSRIAEMHRRTAGNMYARQSTGVNVHYQTGSTGTVRLYGVAINSTYKPMSKV